MRAGPARQLRSENESLKAEVERLRDLVRRLEAEVRAATNARLEESVGDNRPHIRRARADLLQ